MTEMYYRVFVYWLKGERGPGSHHDFKSLADAMLQVRSYRASGYGKDDRNEIQVWKITRERIRCSPDESSI